MGKRVSSEESARKWASVLFWTLLATGGLLLYYLVSWLLLRPYYFLVNLLSLCAVYYYLSHSDCFWHDSQNLENQFWMLVMFMMASNIVFSPDSPYKIATLFQENETISFVIGWFIVMALTLGIHLLDKRIHRSKLTEKPQLSINPADDPFDTTASQKLEQIQSLAQNLDLNLPSGLYSIFNLHKLLDTERKIFSILNDCSRVELNYLIVHLELKLLVYKVKNHNKSTESSMDLQSLHNSATQVKHNRSRSQLMNIFAQRRVSDLSLGARAVVLDTIQALRLTKNPDTAEEAQRWILDLLTTVKGDELSELKTLIDGKGSAESMHKLIYEHVQKEAIRSQILRHFSVQASIQSAQMTMKGSLAKKRINKGAWRKILSDVDDTLFSSGGRYPAGIDTSYKRKVFYPGVTALYKELNIGTVRQSDGKPTYRDGDLVFLSARPHVYKDVTETGMFNKFRKFMKTNHLHCMPGLLPGDLDSGQAFMMKGDFLPMAKKKMLNFEQYYSVYPEYTHVFIGDNGQADVKAAEMMIEKFGKDKVETVYIHQVQPKQYTYAYEPEGVSERKWKKLGIVFCETYIQAAIHAATRTMDSGEMKPLITFNGLRRVLKFSRMDFINVKDTFSDPYERDARRMELNRDIGLGNAIIRKLSLAEIPLIPGDRAYETGSRVFTCFGRGFVSSYRSSDGIYEIILDWSTSRTSSNKIYVLLPLVFKTEKQLRDSQKQLYRVATGKSTSTQSVEKINLSSTSATDDRFTEGNVSLGYTTSAITFAGQGREEKPRTGMRSRSISLIDTIDDEEEDLLEIGTKVSTPYGSAMVLRFREADSIYEMALLSFRASAYVLEDELIKWNHKLFKERASALARSSDGSYSSRIIGLVVKLFSSKEVDPNEPLLPDTVVQTHYGLGNIVHYRKHDQVYEVTLLWGAKAYLQRRTLAVELHLKNQSKAELVALTSTIAKDKSPFQKAKQYVASSRVMSLIRLPFSVMGGGGASPNIHPSSSMISINSMISNPSMDSLTGFFDISDERDLVQLMNVIPGDQVETAKFGSGIILEIRDDGVYVIKLSFGVAYVVVPEDFLNAIASRYTVGDAVKLIYGVGDIAEYRASDDTFTIRMRGWSAMIYCSSMYLNENATSFKEVVILAGGKSSSFKFPNILSFISNMIPSTSVSLPAVGEVEVVVVPTSHTTFSWTAELENSLPPPPGHTTFSWTK